MPFALNDIWLFKILFNFVVSVCNIFVVVYYFRHNDYQGD